MSYNESNILRRLEAILKHSPNGVGELKICEFTGCHLEAIPYLIFKLQEKYEITSVRKILECKYTLVGPKKQIKSEAPKSDFLRAGKILIHLT